MPNPLLLIADPNPERRKALVQHCSRDGQSVQGVATLGEGRAFCETAVVTRIMVAAELAEIHEFTAFLKTVEQAGTEVAIYGTPRSRLPGLRYLEPSDWLETSGSSDPAAGLPSGLTERRGTQFTRDSSDPGFARPGGMAPAGGGQLVLLGASTGGVAALEAVLSGFPADCPPTVVVQHIRDGFAESMVRRFDQLLQPDVLPVEDMLELQRGTIYIAVRGDAHLGLSGTGTALHVRLVAGEPVGGHRPAVDVLFGQGAAMAHRVSVRAALLTGMGADGAAGLAALREAGAYTVAQDRETSVVWGMPRVAIERGAAVAVLPLARIGRALLEYRDAQALA